MFRHSLTDPGRQLTVMHFAPSLQTADSDTVSFQPAFLTSQRSLSPSRTTYAQQCLQGSSRHAISSFDNLSMLSRAKWLPLKVAPASAVSESTAVKAGFFLSANKKLQQQKQKQQYKQTQKQLLRKFCSSSNAFTYYQ